MDKINAHYNLRLQADLSVPSVNSAYIGLDSLTYETKYSRIDQEKFVEDNLTLLKQTIFLLQTIF